MSDPNYQPFRCPGCRRVRWTRADITYCYGGTGDQHRPAEMELIPTADAPAESSPDIVAT